MVTFWKSMCKQFDQNEDGLISSLEIEMMLSCLAPDLFQELIDDISVKLGPRDLEAEYKYDQVAAAMEGLTITNGLMEYDPTSCIAVGECPICTKNFEYNHACEDILVHVNICSERNASGKLDNVMMGGFLTEEHASRKWLSRLFSFVSYGGYQIGKNNGHIFVQDRRTGKVIEEKMPAYIRLGIRLVYQSNGKAADTRMIRSMLHSMTLRQGKKFSSFSSTKSIQPFIKFHQLSVEEVLDPIDSFRSFNEFFYRKLKPGARIPANTDPKTAFCPADCRLTCFPTIHEATQLWIKGAKFSVTSLLKDEQLGKYFEGGSLVICRLAPQDYHRYHAPFECKVNLIYHISGAYFTVNPMAIRQRLDVFTENARTVAILESPVFGKVAYVAIGAMMVGSIEMTCESGDKLGVCQEVGYFAFGGSTIVLIFRKGACEFDGDLVENSRDCLETLVRVGQTLGHCPE